MRPRKPVSKFVEVRANRVLQMPSGQNGFDDIAFFHAGQTLIEPLKFKRQLAMVDAKAMQNRRVDFADVNGILHDVVTEIISLAISHPAFDSAARHPHRETT